jgi:hypothetical protein
MMSSLTCRFGVVVPRVPQPGDGLDERGERAFPQDLPDAGVVVHGEQHVDPPDVAGPAEVEGDALVVAGHALPHQPDPVGLLDLEHFSPVLAHPGGDQGAGREGSGVDHAQPGQGALSH